MLPRAFKIHKASIEVRRGGGRYGDTFDPPVERIGFAQTERRLVRSATGEEVVAEVTLWLDPDVEVTEGSKVTVLGRQSKVLGVGIRDSIGNLDHLEVSLT